MKPPEGWVFLSHPRVTAPDEVGDQDDLFEYDHPGGYGGVVVRRGVAYTITVDGKREGVGSVCRQEWPL